jgi:hypothetical protein
MRISLTCRFQPAPSPATRGEWRGRSMVVSRRERGLHGSRDSLAGRFRCGIWACMDNHLLGWGVRLYVPPVSCFFCNNCTTDNCTIQGIGLLRPTFATELWPMRQAFSKLSLTGGLERHERNSLRCEGWSKRTGRRGCHSRCPDHPDPDALHGRRRPTRPYQTGRFQMAKGRKILL